jgi:hypothetical protein
VPHPQAAIGQPDIGLDAGETMSQRVDQRPAVVHVVVRVRGRQRAAAITMM